MITNEYIKARTEKESELKKKHKYSNIKSVDTLEKADHIIQNELASWTKEYYKKKENKNVQGN